MKRLLIFVFVIACFLTVSMGQNLTFEEFELEQDTFVDPLSLGDGLRAAGFFLPTEITEFPGYGSFWTGGWTVSTKTDSVTTGLQNQYSAKPATGAGGSSSYGIAFSRAVIKLDSGRFTPLSMQVTNSTWAFNISRDGDPDPGFGDPIPPFGGESGDVPDFFKFIIQKYLGDSLYTDSLEFFLADYRFEDNREDFILDTWETIDLSGLGECDSLLLTLDSSVKDQFGILTPAYICMDNLEVEKVLTNSLEPQVKELAVYPNPTSGILRVNIPAPGRLTIWNSAGQQVGDRQVFPGFADLSLLGNPAGLYIIRWTNGDDLATVKIRLQ